MWIYMICLYISVSYTQHILPIQMYVNKVSHFCNYAPQTKAPINMWIMLGGIEIDTNWFVMCYIKYIEIYIYLWIEKRRNRCICIRLMTIWHINFVNETHRWLTEWLLASCINSFIFQWWSITRKKQRYSHINTNSQGKYIDESALG